MHTLSWIVKRIAPLLVGLAVLLQALNKDLVAAAFYFNQRYIAENLCENISQPGLKCNGICQLKKVLRQADAKEKQAAATPAKADVQICERLAGSQLPEQFCLHTTRQEYPIYHFGLPQSNATDIFRPPIGC